TCRRPRRPCGRRDIGSCSQRSSHSSRSTREAVDEKPRFSECSAIASLTEVMGETKGSRQPGALRLGLAREVDFDEIDALDLQPEAAARRFGQQVDRVALVQDQDLAGLLAADAIAAA